MHLARPVFAPHPKFFGKGPSRDLSSPAPPKAAISEELKLFATTFLAGFLFVSILIG